MLQLGLKTLIPFVGLFRTAACSPARTGSGDEGHASAKPYDEDAIVATIEGRLDTAFSKLWAQEQNAEKFVMDYWAPGAVVIASDGPTAWSGYDELVPFIREFMTAYPGITAEPVYTKVAAENVAYQFAQFNFLPADPESEPVPAKSLYVWIKSDGQWKITADHFSYTAMDTPGIAK